MYAAQITWNYALSDNTGFLLQRSTDLGSTWIVNFPQSVTTSYVDTTVISNETYWYRVAATNPVGTGSWSNIGSVIVPGDGGVLPEGIPDISGSIQMSTDLPEGIPDISGSINIE